MTSGSTSAPAGMLHARGVERLADPRVWGTTIGAAGATVFVLANRGQLGGSWPTATLIAWVSAVAAYVWLVFLLPRSFAAPQAPARRAGLIYLGSVVGMLVLIRLGTVLLDDAGRDGLRPALIVVAVGLHFLPFASAFRTPMFRVLGSTMVVLGTSGLVVGWAAGGTWAAAAAVASGITMLVVIAADTR